MAKVAVMGFFLTPFFLLIFVRNVFMQSNDIVVDNGVAATSNYVFWPNATIPFYINPDHFDREQSTSIMTTLALFAFKSCLKFLPVLVEPEISQHVLVFANPDGIRQCAPTSVGHPLDESHTVILGYECLRPPRIEMMVMKALGFPFEHNRASRDVFIDVQFENIDPSAMELFTKDPALPLELRSLAYDVDSVMHFGEREFSKNGHRTIIFKDRYKTPVKQNRVGLSSLDIRKIEIVYGPECRKRDRQEKIELCQNYPGVARRKREVTEKINLRVNRDITPAPVDVLEHVNNTLRDLGIENEVQDVVDQIYKVSSKALRNARAKYCNSTKPDLRVSEERLHKNDSNPDILGIIETIADYARGMVDNAVANLTEFCQSSENIESYQLARARCPFFGARDCPVTYRSTKSGPVRYSTQHRPLIYQSTNPPKSRYARTGNSTDEKAKETAGSRRKRHADKNKTEEIKARRDDEATTIINQRRSVNSTDSPVEKVVKDDNSSKNSLRSNTLRPEVKRVEYEAEWPFPERNHRKHFKGKKRARTQIEEDSQVSVENKREKRIKEREKRINERIKFSGRGEKVPDTYNKHRGSLSRDQSDNPSQDNVPMTVKLSKQNQEFYNERKWPDGVVRYILTEDPNYDMRDVRRRLAEVNNILEKKTCVKLEEITPEESENYEDFLVVDTGADYVTGRVGGRQNFGSLELYRGDQHRQHAAMLAMAMLGFYFELARHDRDKYVRVHLRHVRPDKLHHFEKIRSDATFPLPYDYESATHPAWQFWRKVGIKGISTVATFKSKDPEGRIMRTMGQSENLFSEMDIVKINSVYGTDCFQNPISSKTGKKKRPRYINKM